MPLLTRTFALAAEARAAGDHPFGALLAVDGEIVAEARNLVATNHDLTAHAETEPVRVVGDRSHRHTPAARRRSAPRGRGRRSPPRLPGAVALTGRPCASLRR